MSVHEVANLITHAQHLVILTGAGVSKESGVPTFRDAMDGLWSTYDPQQLATPQAFAKNPRLVWEWYDYRRGLVRHAKPNPGHIALAQLEKTHPSLWLITQNVDDLHEQAGATRMIRLHGNIAQTICVDQCLGGRVPIAPADFVWDAERTPPPRCPHCRAYLRPNVVWFHEMLPADAIRKADEVVASCDVMLVIGTSGIVSPASELPFRAKQGGAKVIEINPDATPISHYADIALRGASGEILPAIMEVMR